MKELIAKYGILIVAVLALAQPWLLAIWRKFFRKGKIDIFPSGTIEAGYSAFGPTIGLSGTLRCTNQNLFVTSINLEITKQKDSSKHLFDWTFFRSQKLTSKGQEAEFELPYSFMLSTSQPKRYNISFVDTNTRQEMQKIIQKVRQAWTDLISPEIQTGIPLTAEIISTKYHNEFSKSKTHVDAYTQLDRLCYWEPGQYSITLKVYTSRPNQPFEERWKFNLEEEQIKAIRLNVVKILQDICMVPSYGQYNFAYPIYEEA